VSALLWVLAVMGGAALLSRLFRSAARLALGAAEVAAASGMAESSARRGDLTRMEEGREFARRARVYRRKQGLVTTFWLLWLAVPLAVGYTAEAYAVAAALWFAPRSGARVSVARPEPPPAGEG
jgi:hypothetical protein